MLTKATEMTESLQVQYQEKKNKEAHLTEVEQGYYQQRNEISHSDEKIKAVEKQKNTLQYQINELKDQHNNLKFRLIAISERMEVEFGVSEDITAEHLNEDMPLEELEVKVQRLRNRLENYGEINPMAIEAHEEIKVRFDNINLQRQDILSAKDSLMSTITEVRSATGQFLESFDKVRENFIEVFRSLFTDDDTCGPDPAQPQKIRSNPKSISSPSLKESVQNRCPNSPVEKRR